MIKETIFSEIPVEKNVGAPETILQLPILLTTSFADGSLVLWNREQLWVVPPEQKVLSGNLALFLDES